MDQDTILPEQRLQPFRARFTERLARLYPDADANALADRLCAPLTHYLDAGSSDAQPAWSEHQAVLITYGDSIQEPGTAPLATLRDFLSQHLHGIIDTVHILPFFPYSSDDGFSVIDYREVNPTLGDWEQIRQIADDFRLMVDLVINHCSRESLWFFDYMADRPPYNRYFREADPSDNLALVTRPRSSPLLTEVRTHRGIKHLWTTFSADQVDLDFRNPDVLIEMIDIMLGYLAAGARVLRLDAVAFLWKEIGSQCVHLPQTHEVVKLVRDILSAVQPDCLLLTETNVPNKENRSYFGDGDEAQLIYQFSLPPLLLHALHTGSTRYLKDWAHSLDDNPPPPGCTYLNFTASHDGVGLRPLEGLLPDDELQSLLHAMHARGGYVSSRRNDHGTESPYELNISYFDAFRDPRCDPDPWHVPAFMVSQIVALSLQGIPAIYIHSLTAAPNDHVGVELSGRIRTINRRKWDRGELEALIANPASETGRVFRDLQRILAIRRQHPAFHPLAPQRILELDDGLFGILRHSRDELERVLCLFNFTPQVRRLRLADTTLPEAHNHPPTDLLTGRQAMIEAGQLLLPAYTAHWLIDHDCGAKRA